MKVLFSPQVNDEIIEYNFEREKITAIYKGESDTFDFSSFPDGKAENIETSLPVNPIVSAERIDGVLHVKLINFIGEDATEEEKFPTWQVIEDGEDKVEE